jgi:N-acetylglucosamine-6-phosphate deacetylase
VIEVTGRLVGSGRSVSLRIAGGRIDDIADATTESQLWISPGPIDIQVNGYAGHDVNGGGVTPAEIEALVRAEWAAGVTTICPTIITGPEDRICTALRAIAQARAADPLIARAIPCVHVEGPYIADADGPRGAHDARYLRNPDLAEFGRWQQAAAGLVGIVTLAPELPGAAEYIAGITRAGVIAAIGHTAATPADIAAAVAAGARLSTHLGNGAHPVLPRHPNYIWAQLAEDRLTASLIADGHHLDDATLSVMLRAKGIERCVLVSDTVALAGRAPGRYRTPVGGEVELTVDGRLTLPGSTLLAGASKTLPECIQRLRGIGFSGADVLALAARNPARLLGLTDRGEIRVQAAADLVLLDGEFGAPVATIVGGELVAGSLPAQQ